MTSLIRVAACLVNAICRPCKRHYLLRHKSHYVRSSRADAVRPNLFALLLLWGKSSSRQRSYRLYTV